MRRCASVIGAPVAEKHLLTRQPKKSKWMLESYHHKVPLLNHIESNNNNQKCDCFVLIDAIDYILVNLLATNLI